MPNPYRSHTCNDLRATHAGQTVRLAGWIHNKRDLGGVLFIDLRDHYGITQIVANSEASKDIFDSLTHVRYESVITVVGKVVARMPETVNKELATGGIEMVVESYVLESPADMLPLQVNSDEDAGDGNEELFHRGSWREMAVRLEAFRVIWNCPLRAARTR